MADETEQAYQALGWAGAVLGLDTWPYGDSVEPGWVARTAFERGLAGEPPPCGCVVAMLAEAERRDALEQATEAWQFALMHEEVAVTLRNMVACLAAHADAGRESHPMGSCQLSVTEGQDVAVHEETDS